MTPRSPFRELGNTNPASFRQALSRSVVLSSGDPPPLHEADAIYATLAPHGLTRLGAAMAWIERSNDTNPNDLHYYGRELHNLWAVKLPSGAWAHYDSYASAATAWEKLVLGPTYADLTTIAEFVQRYAPWSDGNDPTQYGRAVAREVSALPLISTTSPPPPPPPVVRDLLTLIFGGPYVVSQEFGVESNAADYSYGRGHGLSGRQHTGIDGVGRLRDPLFAPFAGTVVCGATGFGGGAWGTGCAAFNDYSDGGGAGRIELLHPDGKRSLIFGHCDTSRVKPGDAVAQGAMVGTVGSMNAPHCHIEARRWDGQTYIIEDPRALFTDVGGPAPLVPAPRLDIPQPAEFDAFWSVEVTQEGLPVLQRAGPSAAQVDSPFHVGETFQACYLVYGEGGAPYWVGRNRGRVLASGTRGPAWFRPEEA